MRVCYCKYLYEESTLKYTMYVPVKTKKEDVNITFL